MNADSLNEISINNSTILTGLTPITKDTFSCNVSVSDYKWLTPALITNQQKYAVQPYYTCQIIDDGTYPISNQTINTPIQGSAVTAPDGYTLAVGLDGSNNVGFWKIADPSQAANWNIAPTVILENNAANRSSFNNYSIKCSEFIKGTYKIDIYFFGNFSFPLSIIHYHSFDGGITWLNNEAVNSTGIVVVDSFHNIYINAGKPYLNNAGNIISTVFYTGLNTRGFYDINYQQYPGTGGSFNTAVIWSQRNVNTQEWIVHSFDNELVDNQFYLVFSAYHSFYDATNQQASVANYNLYVTKIIQLTNNVTTDIWSTAFPIITVDSTSVQNINLFQYPKLFFDGEMMNLAFYGDVLTGYDGNLGILQNNTQARSVIQTVYTCSSADFLNFSYPQPITFIDGTSIIAQNCNGFLKNGNAIYIISNQVNATTLNLTTFQTNNVVADVSLDVLNYTMNDNQQGASTITLTIGNANNKWYAGTPSTQPGYQAIKKNAKINIFQGYYDNASLIPTTAPKDIYYIDDIQQNVSSNTNEFTLAARNIYKKLEAFSTKYTYGFDGIRKYIDYFNDASSAQNYNLSGSWTFNTNLQGALTASTNILALLSLYEQIKPNTIFSVIANLPTNSGLFNEVAVEFFVYYVDSQNNIYLSVLNNGTSFEWSWVKTLAGSTTILNTGTFAYGSDNNNFPFFFVRNDYYKVQGYVGTDASDGKSYNAFATATPLGGVIDFSNTFSETGSIGIGGQNVSASNNYTMFFYDLKYFEFDRTQSMQQLLQSLATKASIFDYKFQTSFENHFYTNIEWSGTYTFLNRYLTVSNGNTATKINTTFTDFEVTFQAAVAIDTANANFGFDFNFKDNNAGQKYFFRISNQIGDFGVSYLSVKLFYKVSGVEYLLACSGGLTGDTSNNLLYDITKLQNYKVISVSSYVFFVINDTIVLSWYDTSAPIYNVAGYIGFRAFNTTLSVRDVVGNQMYTQVETFTLNPGDDLENSLDTVVGITLNFFFSDLLGRFKVHQLNSSDPSTYTYQNQLMLQQVDLSDKEYSNRVTVNGNNVTATVQDNVSIAETGYVKDLVIVDSNITTYTDAVLRANYELVNAKKFDIQYSPKQVLNVGSEIFDVVTVINSGNNSTGVNQAVRTYSQEIDVVADPVSYYLQLDTGQL